MPKFGRVKDFSLIFTRGFTNHYLFRRHLHLFFGVVEFGVQDVKKFMSEVFSFLFIGL